MEIILANVHFEANAGGGAENYVERTARELQDRGHTVSILSTRRYEGQQSLKPKRTEVDGIPVWRLYPMNVAHRGEGTGNGLLTKAVWHSVDAIGPLNKQIIGDFLDNEEPDVVHTNNLMGMSPVTGKTIQQRNIRHVHTLHDYSLICPRSNLLRDLTAPEDERTICENPPTPCRLLARAKRRGLGTPDVVTGPSQHVIDVHHKHGFFEDARCERLQLGVTSVVESPPPVPAEPSLLFVGQHLESKGLETLLDAAEQLQSVRFDICGTGPYADLTERRASELDNVQYHGFVSEEELARLRRGSTAAVVPSIWMENSPLTIYESFAAGLPVVGSDIGGIPELIADGERGYTFKPKSVNGLVEAVENIRHHTVEMRRNVIEWARERTIERHVDGLQTLYTDDVLSRASEKPP